VLGRPLEGPTRLVTAPVYGGIRAVTMLVGDILDGALAQLEPLLGESAPGPEREAILAALNGVLGDYLAETHNPLAIEMRLRHAGHPLVLEPEAVRAAIPRATSKLLILVHGSCMNDLQWTRRGQDYGTALAKDCGYTAVYLRYNSGLHISTNGRAFDALLEQLVAAWPEPIDEVAIVAHSMGGLVSRSACHYAEVAGHGWRTKLRKLVFLGTPHHGAPLERGGNWIDVLLAMSPYSAPLARLGHIRSAGVTDMRFGNVLDGHWQGRGRFEHGHDLRTPLPLPADVDCCAVAATTAPRPADKLPGDRLVPLTSALGQCPRSELSLEFPESHRWIGFGMSHLDLLHRPEVYETIRSWLSPLTPAAPSTS
ncbi:MAG: alpha/beta hydrolase, partial [Polyangiaceae bacterium]|nr:alpha/beta hydrolase [Polyangiaceae bacterium]